MGASCCSREDGENEQSGKLELEIGYPKETDKPIIEEIEIDEYAKKPSPKEIKDEIREITKEENKEETKEETKEEDKKEEDKNEEKKGLPEFDKFIETLPTISSFNAVVNVINDKS